MASSTVELGQRVGERRVARTKRRDGGRTAGLQPELDAVRVGERDAAPPRPRAPAAPGCAAPARTPAASRVADRDLDLRQPVADRQRADELAQLRAAAPTALGGSTWHSRHVGDVARLPLVEADQHAAFLRARGAPTAARDADSPTPALRSAAAASPARTRPMCPSASSSARCLAATCSDGCACCSVQPPQTPKCGQRGVDARRARASGSRRRARVA